MIDSEINGDVQSLNEKLCMGQLPTRVKSLHRLKIRCKISALYYPQYKITLITKY